MTLESFLLIIILVLLSVITFILVGIVLAVFAVRKKVKHLPIGKFGGVMSILPILKFILSQRRQFRR